MAARQGHSVLRFLRRIAALDRSGETPDAQLLTQFIAQRDEAAFAGLVERHGPMVFGVCRRVLGDTPDAEDAFQAAFLVLARRARSVSRPELLGNWLYGVAYRTAQRVRTDAARRQARERQVPAVDVADPAEEAARRDLRRMLDDELSRLPDRYRAPLVLCYLEGHTQEEAARRLGCPRKTVTTRLARACERLRGRLARRGLALPAGALAVALTRDALATVPAVLMSATIQAAALFAAGETAAGVIPVKVAVLAKGVSQAMFATKLKTWGALVLAVAVLGAAGVFAYRVLSAEPSETKQEARPDLSPEPGPKPDPPAPPAAPAAKRGAAPAGAGDLGEEVLPVNKAPNDAPLRPLKGIPIYKLTDLRIGNPGPGPSPKLTVHYERVSGEERGTGPTLVIRTTDGNEYPTLGGFGPFQGQKKAGDIVVDLKLRGGPGGGPPKNLEVYFVQTDRRWEDEGFRPKFKVSNSVVVGEMGRPLQFAREWKPEEVAKLNNPPPAAPEVNVNNTVGEDTAFAGNTAGRLPPLRYADPAKRPVLGVLYRVGQGEPDKGQKVKCLVHLTPAYDARQPRYGQLAVFAKPGYAVGALNVKTKKIVTAVQVVFMKQKPDGTLDPADSYTSQWLGHPEEADQEGKVSGSGRKLIGMYLKHFGVVHAIALVLE